MPAIVSLIATILGAVASARGGNSQGGYWATQIGSSLSNILNQTGSRNNGNLSSRGYPSSRFN